MFSVELKINGTLIGNISGINKGIASIDDPDLYLYEYEYYNAGLEVGEGTITKGNVLHYRAEGIEKLIHDILTQVIEKDEE